VFRASDDTGDPHTQTATTGKNDAGKSAQKARKCAADELGQEGSGPRFPVLRSGKRRTRNVWKARQKKAPRKVSIWFTKNFFRTKLTSR